LIKLFSTYRQMMQDCVTCWLRLNQKNCTASSI